MKTQKISIMQIPAIIWGDPSTKVYLYVHGQGGYKEEAEAFAGIASRHSCQVLSIDLPGYGPIGRMFRCAPTASGHGSACWALKAGGWKNACWYHLYLTWNA